MNELIMNNYNAKITYNRGRIFYEWNKGFTSQLIKDLRKIGYKTVKKGSIYCLLDKDNIEIVNGFNWIEFLYNVSVIMR
jgi:hypothetical protein